VGISGEGLAIVTADELLLLCLFLLLIWFHMLFLHCIQPLNTLHTIVECIQPLMRCLEPLNGTIACEIYGSAYHNPVISVTVHIVVRWSE
jgi:hypothetical protein